MAWYSAILYLWAGPTTLVGLAVAPVVLMQGGTVRVVQGVVEVEGGVATWLLERGLPWCGPAAAMTLGHVVWGQDLQELERTRAHEHVHVRQYERWGPFFIPAYFASSAIAWWRGKNPYYDNVFEVEAYGVAR
jgi:hypothetical protein